MGADLAKDGLAAGDLVEMTGTGTGMDFTPESIMVVGSPTRSTPPAALPER